MSDRETQIPPALTDAEWEGDVTLECPECHATATTADGIAWIKSAGIFKWTGVPCRNCGRSFTVELTRPPRDA